MSILRQRNLVGQGPPEITCPACGGPAQFIERVNRRDIFKCADGQCLGSVGFDVLKPAGCQEGAA
jgi:hypothetical protein